MKDVSIIVAKFLFISLAISFIAYARNRWPKSKFWNPPEQKTRWKTLGIISLIVVIVIIIFICLLKYFPGY